MVVFLVVAVAVSHGPIGVYFVDDVLVMTVLIIDWDDFDVVVDGIGMILDHKFWHKNIDCWSRTTIPTEK